MTEAARAILGQVRDRQSFGAHVGRDRLGPHLGPAEARVPRYYLGHNSAPARPGIHHAEWRAAAPPTVTHALQECLLAAGIDRRRFHFLRHQNASYLLALGVNPKDLQEHLGHADFSTTMNTYAHLVPDATIRIVALVDAARTRASASR